MTRQELIKYYKEKLHTEKIAFKNQRKAHQEKYGHDVDVWYINAHEKECMILRETIKQLRRTPK